MIALDEDALICDFAEFYHIYDYKSFPVDYIATLADGLRNNARIKLKLMGLEIDINTLLLAHIADSCAINFYAKTKDAKSGRNRPKSMVEALTAKSEKQYKQFDTGDDFMREWRLINGN
jgi:hypothetical protein